MPDPMSVYPTPKKKRPKWLAPVVGVLVALVAALSAFDIDLCNCQPAVCEHGLPSSCPQCE